MRILFLPAFRLWHQITLKLVEFFDDPLSQLYQVDVYDRFVRDFAAKLNPLKLVEMGVKVSRQIDSMWGVRSCSVLTFLALRSLGPHWFPLRYPFKNRQRQVARGLCIVARDHRQGKTHLWRY